MTFFQAKGHDLVVVDVIGVMNVVLSSLSGFRAIW
jgi:hypothetical protein